MTSDTVIGWDVGGAHLKAARIDVSGRVEAVRQLSCPLWQGIHHLEAAVDQAMIDLGQVAAHAITMTGEMVDLFPNRDAGVRQLVATMRERLPGRRLRFYAGEHGFLDPEQALLATPQLASANWIATASLVGATAGSALLIDIGSTTTDLIPVLAGRVVAHGRDDAARLVTGELLYTGVVRTPVMALADRAPFNGEWVPLIPEYFATAADLYRLTGQLPSDADLHPAADNGEKTPSASARRLARMLGRDAESAPHEAWKQLAEWLVRRQRRRIGEACDRVLCRSEIPANAPLVGAGTGRFLVAELARERGRQWLDFSSLVPGADAVRSQVSDCAPAVAVAWLAVRSSD